MDFRKEYKNSAEIMGPSEEAMARMKQNIMKQLDKAPAKKTFPFRTAAAVCGGLAACAAVALVCVNVIPRLNAHTDFTAGNSSVAAVADEYNEYSVQAEDTQPMEDAAAAVDAKDMGIGSNATAVATTTAPVMFDIEDTATNAPSDIFADDEAAGDDFEYAEAYDDALVEDVFSDNMDITDGATTSELPDSETTEQDTDTQAEENTEPLFKLSEDMSELFIGDRIYVLVDDGLSPPSAEVVCENYFAPDGTEYWFDRYGDDYIVLSRDSGNGFKIVGGYKTAE